MRLAPLFCIASVFLVASCRPGEKAADTSKKQTLQEQRKGHVTRLTRKESDNEQPPVPPKDLFSLVKYPSPAGSLNAYISPKPADGKKRPLIIWLVGGFSNGIGEIAWTDEPPQNDQSASAFRKAGVLMMYPALRGGSGNPGFKEGFYGEVDDVLAAAAYAATLDYVDTNRIYLGGHSTGGTIALLAAEFQNRFRAVFSLGPVDDPAGYGQDYLPYNVMDRKECRLRSPVLFLGDIATRTFVIEGTDRGNIDSVRLIGLSGKKNPKISVHPVRGGSHFSILAPINALLARKINLDTDTNSDFALTDGEISKAFNP